MPVGVEDFLETELPLPESLKIGPQLLPVQKPGVLFVDAEDAAAEDQEGDGVRVAHVRNNFV